MGGTSMQLVEVNQNTLIQWLQQQTEKAGAVCVASGHSVASDPP